MSKVHAKAAVLVLLGLVLGGAPIGLVACGGTEGVGGGGGITPVPAGDDPVRATWDELRRADPGTTPAVAPRLPDDPPILLEPTADGGAKPTGHALKIRDEAGPLAPLVFTNGFLAVLDNFTTIPPDTHGAAGPNHLVVAINSGITVQDKAGAVVAAQVSLPGFFAPTGHADVFDPRVVYDSMIDRWYVVANATRRSAASALVFAVSSTPDPTGAWTFYALDADAGDTLWADFCGIGLNGKWVCLVTKLFTIAADAAAGTRAWVIQKPSLGGLLALTDFLPGFDVPTAPLGTTVKPCVHYDPADPDLFVVDNGYSYGAGLPATRVGRFTGPIGAPAWVENGFTANGALAPFNFTMPAVQQLGGPAIDAGGSRVTSEPKFRNGTIWYANQGGLPAAAAPTEIAAFWTQLSTGSPPAVLQTGVSNGGAGDFRYYPSLAVNANDDMCMGFSRSSAAFFTQFTVHGRDGTDPANTLDPAAVAKGGEAKYFKDFGTGTNRWGDYSAACIDPVDDLTIWLIGEYASSPVGGTDRWGTWWARESPFAAPSFTSCPPSPQSFECTGPDGRTIAFDYTVTNPSGNAMTVTFTDNGLPAADAPPQLIPAAVPGPSGGTVTFTHTYSIGAHVVVVRADDGTGGIATCTHVVNVLDTTAPTIVCPADVTVECTGALGTVVNYPDPVVSDTCDAALTVACVPPSGSIFPIGTTVVNCTATDDAGNVAACSFNVTVQDTTPPDLTIAVARTLLWLPLNGMADIGLTAIATDVCDADVDVTVTVYSDEDHGAAPLAPDALITGVAPSQRIQLRAQRDAIVNNGRWYIVVVDAVDDAGNRRRDSRVVVVPYNLTTSQILAIRALANAELPLIPTPFAGSAPTVGPLAPPGSFTLLATPFN